MGDLLLLPMTTPADEKRYDLYVVDYNADGREDLIRFREKTNSWELFLSTPQADGSGANKIDGY